MPLGRWAGISPGSARLGVPGTRGVGARSRNKGEQLVVDASQRSDLEGVGHLVRSRPAIGPDGPVRLLDRPGFEDPAVGRPNGQPGRRLYVLDLGPGNLVATEGIPNPDAFVSSLDLGNDEQP